METIKRLQVIIRLIATAPIHDAVQVISELDFSGYWPRFYAVSPSWYGCFFWFFGTGSTNTPRQRKNCSNIVVMGDSGEGVLREEREHAGCISRWRYGGGMRCLPRAPATYFFSFPSSLFLPFSRSLSLLPSHFSSSFSSSSSPCSSAFFPRPFLRSLTFSSRAKRRSSPVDRLPTKTKEQVFAEESPFSTLVTRKPEFYRRDNARLCVSSAGKNLRTAFIVSLGDSN